MEAAPEGVLVTPGLAKPPPVTVDVSESTTVVLPPFCPPRGTPAVDSELMGGVVTVILNMVDVEECEDTDDVTDADAADGTEDRDG